MLIGQDKKNEMIKQINDFSDDESEENVNE